MAARHIYIRDDSSSVINAQHEVAREAATEQRASQT